MLRGVALEIDLAQTRWQRRLGGPFPVSVTRDSGAHGDDRHAPPAALDSLASLLRDRVLDGPIRELVEATRPLSVSPRILWGNVASAVNGAATMIATAQPEWADRSRAIASSLLNQPPLRGTSAAVPGRGFRRRSCCLIYRAASNAAGPVCGDCVLADVRDG